MFLAMLSIVDPERASRIAEGCKFESEKEILGALNATFEAFKDLGVPILLDAEGKREAERYILMFTHKVRKRHAHQTVPGQAECRNLLY